VTGGPSLTTARKTSFFLQASPADAVFYIQKGKIKIVVTSPFGKEAVVAILGAGEFFGEGCLIHQPRRLATARAMTESEVMRVEKAKMIRALHTEPAFAALFRAHLLARNSRAEADLVDQLSNSSEQRLARTLLLLANFGNGRFSCWQISATGAAHGRSRPGSATRRWRRSSEQLGRELVSS
jgi:CRP/FNR family cyclic AMP-dependent transcriptional regulator